jgi:hypothetical protein
LFFNNKKEKTGGDVRMANANRRFKVMGSYIDDQKQPAPFTGKIKVKPQGLNGTVIGQNLCDGGNSCRPFDLYGFLLLEDGFNSLTFLKRYQYDAGIWVPEHHRNFYYHFDRKNGNKDGIDGTWQGQWCSSVRDNVIVLMYEIVYGIIPLSDVIKILMSENSKYPLKEMREILRRESSRLSGTYQETTNANITLEEILSKKELVAE